MSDAVLSVCRGNTGTIRVCVFSVCFESTRASRGGADGRISGRPSTVSRDRGCDVGARSHEP